MITNPKVEIQMKQNAFRQAPCDSLTVSLLLSKLSYYVPFVQDTAKPVLLGFFLVVVV